MTTTWIIVAIAVGGVFVTFGTLLAMARDARPEPAKKRSQVPWLADAVWQTLNPKGFLPRRAMFSTPPVVDPRLIPVDASDRRRAGRLPTPADPGQAPAPLPELRERLLGTPGGGKIYGAVWPVCCDRLATLISHQGGKDDLDAIEAQAGPLDQSYLAGELACWGTAETTDAERQRHRLIGWSTVLEMIRDGEHDGRGINLFHCRVCGRVYVGSCVP